MAEDLVQDYLNDDDFETSLTAHGEGAVLPSTTVITISVDGEDGDMVARHFSGQANDSLALIRFGESRDGQHGVHASLATPGAPAGFLAVKLSESAEIEEGIHVEVQGFSSRQEPPEKTEVPARRDVILSAIGGKGQGGYNGGNGQAGMDGVDGTRATREVDATPGTNGGNGGDAGLGTNGADGGSGGTIEVFVDEDSTHLLFAVQFEVHGGKEGKPGCHGKPGKEGLGGNGGGGHTWNELVGYRYRCTSSCIGGGELSTSTSLIRAGSAIGTGASALMAAVRAQAVQGNDLQAMIARAAQRYGARRHQATDRGACHCKGGDGNCAGCRPVPIYSEFHRRPGLNGRDGRPGAVQTKALFPGLPGNDGSVKIHVGRRDGTIQQYNSRYRLELVDFDVEDENGDGIFEPGEHILVRRIRVRNTGGMPSPKCHIPIYVIPSKWFTSVNGQHGKTLIKGSIEPGTTVTLDSSLMVLIRQSREIQPVGTRFMKCEKLSIRATMPWLNRTLPYFEYTRNIDIQYPVEARHFHYLPTMALGSMSRFSFEVKAHSLSWKNYLLNYLKVRNKGDKALGNSSTQGRQIELRMSFPADCGSLQSTEGLWESTIERQVSWAPAKETLTIQQSIRIIDDVPSCKSVMLLVALYLSLPQDPLATKSDNLEMHLVEHLQLPIQLSAHHTFNSTSNFLLVTNSECTRHRVQMIQNFINDELQMQSDEWNCSLYGGLQYRPESIGADPDYVLAQYRGKVIIFLGNTFKFFGSGNRSVYELCDPLLLAKICLRGSRCLFLDCSDHEAFKKWLESWGFPVSLTFQTISTHQKASQTFDSISSLCESVSQKRSIGGASEEIMVYTLSVKYPWFSFSNSNPMAEAKRIRKYLRHRLPQERFLVTARRAEADGSSKQSHVTILHGLPHSVDITATEKHTNGTNPNPFEAYMIVDALPTSIALDALSSLPMQDTDSRYDGSSPATFSVSFTSRAVYLAILRRLNAEIQTFQRRFSWQYAISIPTKRSFDEQDLKAFYNIHFPTLSTILFYQLSHAKSNNLASKYIQELLVYALASCFPQKKRHIARTVAMPMSSHRTAMRECLLLAINKFVLPYSSNTRAFNDNDDSKPFTTLKEYLAEAKNVHSLRNKNGARNTGRVIMKLLAEFTLKSAHEFAHGQISARDIVPRTEFCTAKEWDQRIEVGEAIRKEVRERTEDAWEAIGGMTLEE